MWLQWGQRPAPHGSSTQNPGAGWEPISSLSLPQWLMAQGEGVFRQATIFKWQNKQPSHLQLLKVSEHITIWAGKSSIGQKSDSPADKMSSYSRS